MIAKRVGILSLVLVLAPTVPFADVPLPTKLKVFFHEQGKPYDKLVFFTVTCYGWASYPGDPGFPPGRKPEPYQPREVYRFAARCPHYGCEIIHNFYLNYLHIDYCSLAGTTEGRSFRIDKYASEPVSDCGEPAPKNQFERQCTLRLTLPFK